MSTKSRDPKKNAENLKILEQLLTNVENRLCADCGSRGPRWCSTTWGTFICIRCSGFHRSMGTHITRVKSVSQDFFTDDEVNNMRATGNALANDALEARLRPGDKPKPESSDEFLQTFLRAKYDHLRYVPPGWVPPHKRAEQEQHRRQHDHAAGRSHRYAPEYGSSPSDSPPGSVIRSPLPATHTHSHSAAARRPEPRPATPTAAVAPPAQSPSPSLHSTLVSLEAPAVAPPPAAQPGISFPEDPSTRAKQDIMSLFDSTPSTPGMAHAGGYGGGYPAGGMMSPMMQPVQQPPAGMMMMQPPAGMMSPMMQPVQQPPAGMMMMPGTPMMMPGAPMMMMMPGQPMMSPMMSPMMHPGYQQQPVAYPSPATPALAPAAAAKPAEPQKPDPFASLVSF